MFFHEKSCCDKNQNCFSGCQFVTCQILIGKHKNSLSRLRLLHYLYTTDYEICIKYNE